MKSITFVMPCMAFSPVGGFKVVNEYARRFADDGYRVSIVYPLWRSYGTWRSRVISVIMDLVSLLWPGRKMYCAEGCRKKLLLSLGNLKLCEGTVFVATSVGTAVALNARLTGKKNGVIYFIQDYEAWGCSEEYVNRPYQFGFKNITISQWLYDCVKKTGADSTLIKNGFDFDYFKLTKPIEDRNPASVAMLYHSDVRKGCSYGIDAILSLKRKYPNLKATFFGVPDRPESLPSWIEYYKTPEKNTHNHIYNSAAIFIAPSLQEGWGLTVGEAMICGCAIVCTDIGGFHEMCTEGINALMSPVKDVDAMAGNIERLMTDDVLRLRLAREGLMSIRKFNWDDSFVMFREVVDACERMI